jgi:hypothetical protein
MGTSKASVSRHSSRQPTHIQQYLASVKEERPPPDFCEETQSFPMKLGTVLAFICLGSAGILSGLLWMLRQRFFGTIDPLQEKKKGFCLFRSCFSHARVSWI